MPMPPEEVKLTALDHPAHLQALRLIRLMEVCATPPPPPAPPEVEAKQPLIWQELPVGLLELLPDVLFETIVDHVVRRDLPQALRLCQSCCVLRRRLARVQVEANARRIQWLPQKAMVNGAVSEYGCTLTCSYERGAKHDFRIPWALGSELPTVGKSSWLVRVEKSGGNNGAVVIGVSDWTGCHGWGLHLYTGLLVRRGRSTCGKYIPGLPPPPDWPDGDHTQILTGDDGKPTNLDGRADGALIEVTINHDAGELAYTVNGGHYLHALSGFPLGARLCLWARLVHEDDRVSLVRGWL